jgi:uncharacterized protein YndB with AHSA1/START domain
MAKNCMRMDASPGEVFAILADARTYEHWVVGCDDIRAVEGDWPEIGAHFFHTVGLGPFKVKDNTKVLEVEPDARLVLEARARPAGVAKVVFELAPVIDDDASGATEVTIVEYPVRGLAKRMHNPVLDAMIHLRNAETLRRLNKQVQQRRESRASR